MRVARLSVDRGAGPPALVIAAHGSRDPGFAAVVGELAAGVGAQRDGLDVRIGYLDHGPPHLADVAAPPAVVVPLLLSSGYHVHVDIPAAAPGCTVTPAVGPDPRLAPALIRRLQAAGWLDGTGPVVLGAAGSSDAGALADVHLMAEILSKDLDVSVVAGFAAAGQPLLAPLVEALHPVALASYLLAPGRFATDVAALHPVVSAPIGAAPEIVAILLDRYDAAIGSYGRTAPT